jgi:hypothetical protein
MNNNSLHYTQDIYQLSVYLLRTEWVMNDKFTQNPKEVCTALHLTEND